MTSAVRCQKPFVGSVEHENRLLFHILRWNKSHVGSSHRFADSLGIGGIVLVGFDVGLHELWRDQFDRVPETLEAPGEEVRP